MELPDDIIKNLSHVLPELLTRTQVNEEGRRYSECVFCASASVSAIGLIHEDDCLGVLLSEAIGKASA